MPDPVHPGAPDSLIEHWQRRRGALGFGPGESLPPLEADLDAIAREVVPPDWPALPPDASGHARKAEEIAPEFAGRSMLFHLHALLIAHLRKRRFPDQAPALFRRLWTEHPDALRAGLSTRWLISAVITFGEHGATEGERSLGREMGMLFSAMKLYEFERLFSGQAPDQPFRLGRRAGADMPMGMEPFSLATGGLDINLLAPLWQRALDEPVMGPLACDLLHRLNTDHGTVFARLQAMREKKRRRMDSTTET
ncbi:MAG: hypothetical protein ACT4OK_00855 [Gemmobacter sp.]